jgi:integrase
VRAEYGATKRGLRRLALPQGPADRLRKRRAGLPGDLYIFPNPLDRESPREVSCVTKRVRRLLDSTLGDDGHPMTWASSHSFRRTLVTDAHDAGTPDRHIAGQTGHGRIQVLQDHYIARVPASTVAADLRDLAPRITPVNRGESDSESDHEVNDK